MKQQVDRNYYGKKRVMKIGFKKKDENDDTWSGCVGGRLTDVDGLFDYIHVELIFSDDIVTSITRDPGCVHYDERKALSSLRYSRFYEFYVSPEEEEIMQLYAKNAYERKTSFNQKGLFWNFLLRPIPCFGHCIVREEGNLFFCSEYIVTILQTVGLMISLDPALSSPNDVFHECYSHPKFYKETSFLGNRKKRNNKK